MAVAFSWNGLKMPSTAEELAALKRSSAARRAGSRNQGLLVSSESFMDLGLGTMTKNGLGIVADGATHQQG